MATAKHQAAKNEKLLQQLARLQENKRCAICTAQGPQCTCHPPGIFVCTQCGGVIRQFPGFRIKSRTMATYSADEVNTVKDAGNKKFQQTYLGKWNSAAMPPPIDRNPKKIEAFVKHVLVEKNFYKEASIQEAPRASQPPSPAVVSPVPRIPVAPPPATSATATSTRSVDLLGVGTDSSASDASIFPAFSQATTHTTESSSFDPFALPPTTPTAPKSPAIAHATSGAWEDAFSQASTSSFAPAAPPSTAGAQEWQAFGDGGDAFAPASVAPGGDNVSSTEQPGSPKESKKMRELPMDLFSDPTPQYTNQYGAFGANPSASPQVPGMMQVTQMTQQPTPNVQAQFQNVQGMVIPGHGYLPTNNIMQAQAQLHPTYQAYQAQAGMIQPNHMPGYGVAQPGMMVPGMTAATPAGHQGMNGGLQTHMVAGGPQPGAQGLFSQTSLQETQAADNGLFRNLVDDIRSSLPPKSQRSIDSIGRMGSFGLTPSGYQTPSPRAGGLGFGVGAQSGLQAQQQPFGNPRSTVMGQSGLMGASPQGGFSTSGNPFA